MMSAQRFLKTSGSPETRLPPYKNKGEPQTMHDIIVSHILTQEVERERRQQFELDDPDHLYRHEIWDSQSSPPTAIEVLASLISWIKRRRHAKSTPAVITEREASTSTQCAPQG